MKITKIKKWEDKYNRLRDKHNKSLVKEDVEIKPKTVVKPIVYVEKPMSLFICINTHNRYNYVKNTIEYLNKLKEKYFYNIDIMVMDDCSTDDYIFNDDIIYVRNENNHGKKKYWETINKCLSKFKESKCNYFLQLDDDFLLCDDFLTRLMDEWQRVSFDKDIVAMSLHRDSRTDKQMWGTNNWVDGGTLYRREFLSRINFNINRIGLDRWRRNPHNSSGVWHQITQKINIYKYKVHKLKKSLVYHIDFNKSHMNPNARKNKHIKTINFYGRTE